MPSVLIRTLLVAAVLAAGAALLLRGTPPGPPQTANATVLPQPRALPDFALQDTAGESFTLDSLGGDFTLMFFGFTNCPDVCPITLQMLAATLRRFEAAAGDDRAGKPRVVFVSVDPHRDTAERIRSYLDGFDREFTGVTGSEAALEPLLRTLGVTVEKHMHAGENYNVVHNGTIYFIGPRSDWIAISSPPHDPATLAADFVAIRDAYGTGQPVAASGVAGADPAAVAAN